MTGAAREPSPQVENQRDFNRISDTPRSSGDVVSPHEQRVLPKYSLLRRSKVAYRGGSIDFDRQNPHAVAGENLAAAAAAGRADREAALAADQPAARPAPHLECRSVDDDLCFGRAGVGEFIFYR